MVRLSSKGSWAIRRIGLRELRLVILLMLASFSEARRVVAGSPTHSLVVGDKQQIQKNIPDEKKRKVKFTLTIQRQQITLVEPSENESHRLLSAPILTHL
jgi:hypothetical protein